MSGGQALQTALVVQLQQLSEFSGIYDGPPARASYPYLVIDCGQHKDWGTKDRPGREVSVALTVWDDQPARLQDMADAVEARLTSSVSPNGWSLTSLRFLGRHMTRDVAGPWATTIDYRARMLAQF